MAPYLASQLMREPEQCSVLLMPKRVGNKQTISPLKQVAEAFQFTADYHSSDNATNREPCMEAFPQRWLVRILLTC